MNTDAVYSIWSNVNGVATRLVSAMIAGRLGNDSRLEIARILRRCAELLERYGE